MVGLWLRNEPPDHKITDAMVTKPAATNTGPKVNAAQYSSNRWPQGRTLLTRQIALRLRSMVNTKAKAENISAAKLTTPSRLALVVNCVR